MPSAPKRCKKRLTAFKICDRLSEVMRILNLTQHVDTAPQLAAGVVEPDAETKGRIRELLTFTEIPSAGNIELRAGLLAKAAEGYDAAMVGGAPYLMPALARHLSECNVKPLCSFTERKSVERPNEKDGSVEKVSVFEHIGFVEMPL